MIPLLGLIVAVYAVARLLQVPLESSGSCGVPFGGLPVRIRVWIICGVSAVAIPLLIGATIMLLVSGSQLAEIGERLESFGDVETAEPK